MLNLRIASILALVVLLAQPARALDADEWRADLVQLVETMQSTHINLYHTVSEAEFNETVQRLHDDIPSLSDAQIALRMRRIAAMIGDGHTWVGFHGSDLVQRLPLTTFLYEEGYFITDAMPPNANLIGAEIVAVGRRPVAELRAAAEPYMNRDNEWSLLSWIPDIMCISDLMVEHGFAETAETVTLTLRRDGADEREVAIETVAYGDYRDWLKEDRPAPADAPLYRQRPGETYWMQELPEHDALYAKFNAVQNKEGGPHLPGFAKQLVETFDAMNAKRLIIDARHNGGGNGGLLKPVIRRFAAHPVINQEGNLFVITGRHTFSAALMFTVRMERNTNVLFAGEPGGGKPNSYSEFNGYELEHSKLIGSVSSLFHQEGEPDDTREYVDVDIPVPVRAADYFANRDPTLEAVLNYGNQAR